MAGRKRPRDDDTDEECAELDRRSNELLNKRRRLKLESGMKKHPQLVDDIWKKLPAMGWTEARLKEDPTPVPKSRRLRAQESAKAKNEEKANAKLEEIRKDVDPDDTGVAELVLPVPGRAENIGGLSLPDIRDKLLAQFGEPVISSANLKALPPSDEYTPKQQCGYINEYVTGTSVAFELKGRLRCFNRLGAYLRAEKEKRGPRAKLLNMPPHWPTDGLLIKEEVEEDGSLGLRHRITNEVVHIPAQKLPPYDNEEQLYLAFNWSEMNVSVASMANPSNDKMHCVGNYFSTHLYSEEAASPRKQVCSKSKQTVEVKTPLKPVQSGSAAAASSPVPVKQGEPEPVTTPAPKVPATKLEPLASPGSATKKAVKPEQKSQNERKLIEAFSKGSKTGNSYDESKLPVKRSKK